MFNWAHWATHTGRENTDKIRILAVVLDEVLLRSTAILLQNPRYRVFGKDGSTQKDAHYNNLINLHVLNSKP